MYKEELEKLKRLQGEIVRREKKIRKQERQEEEYKNKLKKQEALFSIQELEMQLRSKKSSSFDSQAARDELERLKELQETKQSLESEKTRQFDFSLGLTESNNSLTVNVPSSTLKRSLRRPPATYQYCTKSGDVVHYYLVNEKTPTFDPLVKAKAKIDPQEYPLVLNTYKTPQNVARKIERQVQKLNKVQSLPPVIEKIDPPPRENYEIRTKTPRGKVHFHTFRDIDYETRDNQKYRPWVNQRIKSYSHTVKRQFRPSLSLNKTLQMQNLREKETHCKPFRRKRIKLASL